MDLKKLSEKLYEELAKYGERELSLSSLDTIDKLAHAIKNIDKIEEQGGSSNRGSYRRSYDSYDGDMSNRYRRSYDSYDGDGGSSSRRGRDSMGRYTGDGYSRHGIVDRLEELSEQTNDDRVKSELRKMISQMENN